MGRRDLVLARQQTLEQRTFTFLKALCCYSEFLEVIIERMAEGDVENQAQIQEETVSSLTEDVKAKIQKDNDQNGEMETDEKVSATTDEQVEVESCDNGENKTNGLDHKE